LLQLPKTVGHSFIYQLALVVQESREALEAYFISYKICRTYEVHLHTHFHLPLPTGSISI